VRRAVATFSSAEEWGRYTELGAIVAFGLAAGANKFSARIGWLICGLASLCAVLLSGQRTAVFGLMVGLATLVLLGASTWPRAIMRVGLLLLPAVLIVAFVSPPTDADMWSKGDNETVSTLLSHTQRGTLKPSEEESLQVRLENWKSLVTQVIPYRPLGAGLGAGSLSEIRFNPGSDLPPIDSFFLVLAVACGIPGVLLFVWILSRATWLSVRTARRATPRTRNADINRIVAALMPALILNSMFGLTFTIYSVAPVAWLLIGWISAETQRAPREDAREILTI